MAKRILITGNAGFLGSHLVDRLIGEHHQLFGIDDLSGGLMENINPSCEFYTQDLRVPEATADLIDKIKPEIIYHLAANAAENKAQFSPIDISSRNYNTFLNVITPAIRNKVKRVIVTSSIAVYGAQQTPFKETDLPQPEDIYGVSKLAMEQTLKILAKVHEFEYVIVRPHNCYGPRQNMTDPYRNVVTIFMNAVLKGEPYYIYGDGEQRRCFTYVDDVIDALVKCGSENVSGMTFNIGSDLDYSVNHLSNVIRKTTGTSLEPMYISTRPQEVKVAVSDHTLSKQYLGYEDRTVLDEGIKRTWEWAKEQGYQEPNYTGFEIDSEKIPSNWRKND